VKSNKWNFNFEENGFHLEIIYGMTGQKIVIPKSEFQYLNNRWVFSFPTDDMVGQVKARLVMELFDPDCPDDTREEVDEQYIAFVVTMPCPKFFKSKKCCQQDSDIVVRIADNGEGMTDEVSQRLYDNFFTTKPVGQGTGLGMAITRDIIENKHHGRLTFETQAGEGTCFTMTFPIQKQ
jgi:nitrogen fixation/metabolism regulation signal transduction histidine kinase